MKIYKTENVYDAAIKRVTRLFEEFENIVVGFSGGKDSVATLHIAMEVARKMNRLPIRVLFIDQEAEWQGTIDLVKEVMYNKDVIPMWYQMPMVITNNASSTERYSYCWNEAEKDKWIHEKDDISIKENVFGTDRFHELFEKIFLHEFQGKKSCYLAGVRTEESPKRFVSLTHDLTYKDITYGKVLSKKNEHYTFYPIYDWSYTDVWKTIFDKKLPYNRIYDEMYRHGVNLNEMRISNVHHETAIRSLLLIQEIEPKTWEKVTKRIDGANTIKHLKEDAFHCPKELPSMFKSWREYAQHLIDNLVQDQKNRDRLNKIVTEDGEKFNGELIQEDFFKTIIKTILASDWDYTKYANWKISGDVDTYRRFHINKKYMKNMLKSTKYLTNNDKEELFKIITNDGFKDYIKK
ncbi:phosphoadenosine phosphosulfate reductase family protein [Candidatus Saccharibacteria bacterium]|nr:phosphoadenosine phosphosulfate reductase family protein [Candidatus Saccharibacteria bacterium]